MNFDELPVEGDIVLGHELVVSNVFRVLPPFLPFTSVVGGDADVTDGSVEPHVEDLKLFSDVNLMFRKMFLSFHFLAKWNLIYLIFISFERDRSSPLEITCDAPRLKSFVLSGRLDPTFCDDPGVVRPLLRRLIVPRFKFLKNHIGFSKNGLLSNSKTWGAVV